MFYIEKTYSDVLVQNFIFDDNVINGQIFYVSMLKTFEINDALCKLKNFTSDFLNTTFEIIGGSIKTTNIFIRKFENLRLIDSFSDQTSFGIKIIDTNEFEDLRHILKIIEEEMVSLFNFKFLFYFKVLINNCTFYNNSLYIKKGTNNNEIGGSIFISSDYKVILRNSSFKNNVVDSDKKVHFLPSSACIYSVSLTNM